MVLRGTQRQRAPVRRGSPQAFADLSPQPFLALLTANRAKEISRGRTTMPRATWILRYCNRFTCHKPQTSIFVVPRPFSLS